MTYPTTRAPRIAGYEDCSTREYEIAMLLRGFRAWSVGSRNREVVRERLAQYGYTMTDEEFNAPQRGLRLGTREEGR